MSELLLSFYPSVESLLSLLPAWEISAIPLLLLGLAQAGQCDGLAQRLLEVNRKILRILLDHSSGQPRNQGLSRGHDEGFLGALSPSPSLSLFWDNCKKKFICAIEWVTWRVSNAKPQPAEDAKVYHGAGAPSMPAPAPHSPAQHLPKEETRMLVSMSHSSDRTDKLQQPASSQPAFSAYCLLPSWRGSSKALGAQSPNYQGLAERTVN